MQHNDTVTSDETAERSQGGTPFEAFGGEEFFQRLVHGFYERVGRDPILRPMYPDEDLSAAERRLRLFLMQYWGGPQTYSEDDGEVFLGRSVTRHKHVSDVTAHAIDEEVRDIIDSCYSEAKRLLQENEQKLHVMAEALIKYETIDENQIRDIMKGQDPRPPQDWDEPSEPGEPAKVGPEPSDGGTAPLGGPASQH